nr:hypothetical protein [uncultured Rhodopila sp.]
MNGLVRLIAAFTTASAMPTGAIAAPQSFQYEFNGCVVSPAMAIGVADTATGQLWGQKQVALVNHGPGTTEQELQITFVTRPDATTVQVAASGSYGSGVKFYSLSVPESYFNWILTLTANYKPVHVFYKYEVDDQGVDTLQGLTVGPVPPSVSSKCP